MNLIISVFRIGVENPITSPPSIDQQFRLRAVKAKDYQSALEIIVKEEIHATKHNAKLDLLQYQQAVSNTMTHYNNHLLLTVSFAITWKEFLGLARFIIKKDETLH